ncbi:golgin subfamily A member 5-like isoform X2 [Ornithodoros turicata]|uniref:golgin subfamily A member 5-like isoform X2 n=1 Tax=Ornithodoros turicata TaxID=34597 RepID=UPI00313920BD
MGSEQEDGSSVSVPDQLNGNTVEESIVSTVQQLSSALLDTSCNIQNLDQKLHKYHEEQNAEVRKLKEDIIACKEQISSGSFQVKPEQQPGGSVSLQPWHMSSEPQTSTWKMLRDKEQTIIDLERRNQNLHAKYNSALDKLKTKCSNLSHQLTESAQLLAEKEKRVVVLEGKLSFSEQLVEEHKREIAQLERQAIRTEEELKKQLAKAEGKVEVLEQELFSQKSKHSKERNTQDTELRQLQLELHSWQEKHSRERQKTSQLSEEVSRLEADLQRSQDLESTKVEEEHNLTVAKCKAKEEELSEMTSRYNNLKKECSSLRKKLAQVEHSDDISQLTKSREYERLKLQKRDIEEVCLSFDRRLQKQALIQKKLEDKVKDCEKQISSMTKSNQQKEKAYQDLAQYMNEKVDLLVGLLSIRSSDTFKALFTSETVERQPAKILVAEMKGKLYWVIQEVRGLCLLELELKAKTSRSTESLINKVRKGTGKKSSPF